MDGEEARRSPVGAEEGIAWLEIPEATGSGRCINDEINGLRLPDPVTARDGLPDRRHAVLAVVAAVPHRRPNLVQDVALPLVRAGAALDRPRIHHPHEP